MSRQYVAQVNNQNFVYPNQNLEEYDVEIVHDINDNCVSGTTGSFSATTITSTGITFSHTRTFNMNGAQPFTSILISPLINVPYLSVHCQVPNQPYMNTWRLVDYESVSTATPNTLVVTGGTNTFTIVPSQFGLASFSSGVYSFEFRFIGQNCLYKICSSLNINLTTPTPTPTPTATSTPTPTPTAGPITSTPTPTPTATPAPVGQCYCFPIVVTGTTIPGPEGGTIATLQYNDCYGVLTARAFTVGPGTYYQCIQVISSVVQYDPIGTTGIDQSYLTLTYLTGNCNTGYVCTGYDPAATPTPTPTATAAPSTPTPTPTATAAPATPTPTPTVTSTPTPTPTQVPVDFSISNTCVGQIGYLTISGGTGGSGTYQFNQYYYASAAAASGTTTGYTVSTDAVWSNIPDGTWYFVMRDNTNNSNKIVKSAVVNCDSNPPSCVTGVTFNVTGVPIEMFYQDCEGVVQSVTYVTTGSKTIADCLQVNSLNSPDYTYDSVVYAGTVCTPVTPTPTPTVTPTPTPTATPTTPTYDYYSADVFPCTDCGGSTDTILVAFDAGSVVTLNRFYLPVGGPDGNSYRVTTTASPGGPAFLLTTAFGSFGTCALACVT